LCESRSSGHGGEAREYRQFHEEIAIDHGRPERFPGSRPLRFSCGRTPMPQSIAAGTVVGPMVGYDGACP
jgi:hypothetical protein